LPKGNDVKVDVTMREQLVYPLQDRPVLRGYEEFSDLPEERLVSVYSLEEIATEKTLALADNARNEPRDLYDLWHLTSNEGIELGVLADGMRQKLEFRGKPCEGLANAIRAKEARLRTLWEKRLGYQMVTLPEFDEVFRAVQRTLRQANLP
jgi:predicted nucleotidyltransferase component of viral defense system